MQLFKLKTRLSKFDHFADFAREFKLSEHDFVITNEFLYDPFMNPLISLGISLFRESCV